MEVLAIIGFFAVKIAAYSGWCWLGLRLLRKDIPPSWRRAALHGVLRVALGLILGLGMVATMTYFAPAPNRLGLAPVSLLAWGIPLRFLEWSLVGASLLQRGWTLRGVLGGPWPQQAWRVGGVLLSFATDISAIFGVGVLGMIPC